MAFHKDDNAFNDYAFDHSIDKSIESTAGNCANFQQGDIIETLTPSEMLSIILEVVGVDGAFFGNRVDVTLGKHKLVVRPKEGWSSWSEDEPSSQLVAEVQLSSDLRFHNLKLLNEFNSRVYGVKAIVNVEDAICVNTLLDMEYGLPIELICDLIRQTTRQAKAIYLSPAIGIFDDSGRHRGSKGAH